MSYETPGTIIEIFNQSPSIESAQYPDRFVILPSAIQFEVKRSILFGPEVTAVWMVVGPDIYRFTSQQLSSPQLEKYIIDGRTGQLTSMETGEQERILNAMVIGDNGQCTVSHILSSLGDISKQLLTCQLDRLWTLPMTRRGFLTLTACVSFALVSSTILAGCGPITTEEGTPVPTRVVHDSPTQIPSEIKIGIEAEIQLQEISEQDPLITRFDKEELWGYGSRYYSATSTKSPHCKVLFATGVGNYSEINRHQFHPDRLNDPEWRAKLLLQIQVILNAGETTHQRLLNAGIAVPNQFTIRIIPNTNTGEDWTGISVPDNIPPDWEYSRPSEANPCDVQTTYPIVALFSGKERYLIEATTHEIFHFITRNAAFILYEAFAVAFSYKLGNFTNETRFAGWAQSLMEHRQIPLNMNSYNTFGFYVWLSDRTGIPIEQLSQKLENSWFELGCPSDPANQKQTLRNALSGSNVEDFSLNQLLSLWFGEMLPNSDGTITNSLPVSLYTQHKQVEQIYMPEHTGSTTISGESKFTSQGTFTFISLEIQGEDYAQLTQKGFRIRLDFDSNLIIAVRTSNGDTRLIQSGEFVSLGQEFFVLNNSGSNQSITYNWIMQ